MKELIRYTKIMKPYRKKAFFSILFNALSVIFALFSYTMVIPLLRILFNPDKLITTPVKFSLSSAALQHNMFYYLSKIITENGVMFALIATSIVVVVASLLKNGFIFIHKYLLAPIIHGISREYKQRLYSKFIELRLGFFSNERKGDLLSRLTNDVQVIMESAESILILLFTGPISIIFYMTYLFYISWQLTAFVLIFLPIMGFIITKISNTLKKEAYEVQEIQGEIVSNTEESISGLRIIKAFNAEKKSIKRFNLITDKYFRIKNKVERRIWLASPLSEFMATIIIMVIMYVGGILVLGDSATITSESFIAYIIVFSQVIPPAKSTINSYYNIQKGMASYDRINEILDLDEKIHNPTEPQAINNFSKQIKYEKVGFRYEDDRKILNNINIEVKKGETVAIVGESGSGKSTLVDLLPRFYDIQEGHIEIDGIDIKQLDKKELRNLFGVVSQSSILFNDTIENNIAFGVKNYTQEQLEEAAKIANAYDFIKEKPQGFKTNIGESGTKLSGGQRQRISIARAVLKNPPILILDEATSALDTESEQLVQNALNNIMKNRTAIVIAHRLSTVKNADKIYVVHEGEIIEEGNHSQLIKQNGTYKKLVDMQMM